MPGLFAGFETRLNVSVFEFVREFLADLREDTYAISAGMVLLPRELAEGLGDSIR